MGPGSDLIGRTLAGRFRVTGYIGEGAMAAVYRGAQDAEPRDVAIKVLHSHLADDEKILRRFRREAKAAARLRHPSSVKILGYGVEGRHAFIVMELLAGCDLYELLELERRLPAARAARIVIQVCDALAAAHELGIVHRDLKPENVMLLDDAGEATEQVRVLDFGIAKILERASDLDQAPSFTGGSALTNLGSAVGTPAYMSPEQCQGAPVDHRADIYACGALLYELVTGQRPFEAQSDLELMLKHLREAPRPPQEIVPGLHPSLASTILRALAKAPGERQQTARDLQRELGTMLPALEQVGGPGRVTSRRAPSDRPARTLVYGAAQALDEAPTVAELPRPPPSAPPPAPPGPAATPPLPAAGAAAPPVPAPGPPPAAPELASSTAAAQPPAASPVHPAPRPGSPAPADAGATARARALWGIFAMTFVLVLLIGLLVMALALSSRPR